MASFERLLANGSSFFFFPKFPNYVDSYSFLQFKYVINSVKKK